MPVAAAAALLACAGTAEAASTIAPLFGGGATTGEKPYREIFNQYGNTATNDLCAGLTNCPASSYRTNVEVLYLGIGSSAGLKAFDAANPATLVAAGKAPDKPPVASSRDFGPFYGTGTGSGWTPSGTATNYFPKLHFASADGLNASDVTAATALGFGKPIQVPSLITPVAINFTPATGTWTPKGTLLAGGSSKVNISTNTLCGIFTGAITDWSNAEITKDNKNVKLGSGQITVVFRNDGAATTFFLANALLNQCGTEKNPVSTHPVPDQWLTDNNIPNTAPYRANNLFFINVFQKGHLPANFYNNSAFAGVVGGTQGNGGMQQAVDATPGAVGYVAPDFAQPIATGNDKKGNPIAATLNLQSYYTFSKGLAPAYKPPSATAASYVMSGVTPPSSTGGASAPFTDPLNWGPVNPAPTSVSAYAIGGFQYFLLYSCYSAAADVNALVSPTAGALGLFRWYYGSATENGGIPGTILKSYGYSAIPSTWITAVKQLLTTNAYTKIGTPGQAKTACVGVSKGA